MPTQRWEFLLKYLDLEAATGVDGARWEHFQYAHLNDDSTFRIENKSRQIAWSWLAAAEGVAEAVLNGTSSSYVSINLDEAAEKVRYAKQIYHALRIGGLPKMVRDSLLSVEFDSGARLLSLPARPPRGKSRMNIYLDEFAHVMFDKDIYTAALPVISKGGRLRIGSSPMGASGRFWEVFSESLQKYPGYNRKSTPWWECYSFCSNPAEARKLAPAMQTAERIERYGKDRIKAIYANMPEEDFRQEYECHLASTLVRLADGTLTGFAKLKIGDALPCNYGGKVTACSVTDARRVGAREIVRVTLETGATFAASKGHPVKGQGGKVAIEDADELRYVPVPRYALGQELALARLVGFNLGDGTIAKRTTHYVKKNGDVSTYAPHYQASFYSARQEDLERVAEDLVAAGLCAHKPNVLFKKGGRPEYDAYQVHVDRDSVDRLIAAGCVVGKKTEQDFPVPSWIMHGSADVKAEFLAALFGAEGNTPREKMQNRGRQKLPQTLCLKMVKRDDCPQFFEQLVALLAELGVAATLTEGRERSGKRSYTVYVPTSAENAVAFFERVGYRYAAKKERAAFLWAQYIKAYQYEATIRREAVRQLRDQGMSYRKTGQALGISAQCAYNLANKAHPRSSWGFATFPEWVAARYADGALALRVVGRQAEPEQEVYNITVDSPDHSYLLADGLDNYNCEFVDESTSWITWEEIKAIQDPKLFCMMVSGVDNAIRAINRVKSQIGNIEQVQVAGVDIGRTRNTTEIYVVGLVHTGQMPLRLAITLDNVDFQQQADVLCAVCRHLPIATMWMDQNGIGRNLAETVSGYYPGKAAGVNFTNAAKALWAANAKMLIQQHKPIIPPDRDLAYQLHSIKKRVTPARNVTFDTDTNEKHHADKAWAIFLALSAALELSSGPSISVEEY